MCKGIIKWGTAGTVPCSAGVDWGSGKCHVGGNLAPDKSWLCLAKTIGLLSLSSAKLAASGEGADIMSVELQQQNRRYFVRLGSLSDELLQLAYLHSKDKVKQIWQGLQEALGQPHSIIELVGRAWCSCWRAGVDQKFGLASSLLL